MNIYFLNNPQIINPNAFQALLKVLNINCLIDLVSYKPTVINHISSHNQIFSEINEKYILRDMLPNNFHELSKEEKNRKYTLSINRIFGRIIEKSKKYQRRDNTTKIVSYEKDNILVLCFFQKQKYIIDYCARYFLGAIINQKICKVDFFDIYKLNFGLRQSEYYNKYYKFFPPYAHEYDFQSFDDYREYSRDRDSAFKYYHSGNFWHDDFSYDTNNRTKSSPFMDDFFTMLEILSKISEKDFYREDLYEKIIISRKMWDESEIERILDEENQQLQRVIDEMDYN